MMDIDDSAVGTTKQCFAPIQSRRLWAPVVSTACRLCPSMDLVLVTVQSPSVSISLHRTESWQKLSSLSNESDDSSHSTHVAWSPDGRAMAVAWSDGTVCLHHVELMMANGSSRTDATGEDGLVHTIESLKEDGHMIMGLTWAHVGKPHSQWHLSESELEQAETWRYRSKYLDRSNFFLPPSSYHSQRDEHDAHGEYKHEESEEASTISTLPTSKTPLSLLCVATTTGTRLYLHGRYHIATLPCNNNNNVDMVCSSDLTYLLAKSSASSTLSLYSLPALKKHRYHYQTISSLYCSITCHLQAIRQHSKETLASFKSALKPLDTKLAGLVRLLNNYGVSESIRQVFLQYLLVGHSNQNDNVTNAMDQFFTNVQMNDQLIQRLERTLHGSLASVESMARKGLLAPAQALVFATNELQNLLSERMQLHQSSEILLVTIQHLVTILVEARFRLRDLVSWLRSVGSQIKARGTAADAPQRENAKKRRVPQAVVTRMATYLQKSNQNNNNNSTTTTTESLLGVPFSDFFAEDPPFVLLDRFLSCTKAAQSLLETKEPSPIETPTINFCLTRVSEFVDRVFAQPRETLSQSVSRTKLVLPTSTGSKVSIHTRIGMDRKDPYHEADDDPFASSDTTGLFQPSIVEEGMHDKESYSSSRHWAIVAATGTWLGNESVDIYCLALGGGQCADQDDYSDSNDEDGLDPGILFYLTSRFVLPSYCRVKEISFYGDDGKSSLSSGTDSGTGQEGRQAIGLLLDRGDGQDETPSGKHVTGALSEELWLLQYDQLVFQPVLVDSDNDTIALENSAGEECISFVQPMQDNHDDSIQEDDSIVYAKTRQLRMHDSDENCTSTSEAATSRLMLSGSRGVGGVFTTANNMSTLDLFDLEEDEEEESDVEDDEDL